MPDRQPELGERLVQSGDGGNRFVINQALVEAGVVLSPGGISEAGQLAKTVRVVSTVDCNLE